MDSILDLRTQCPHCQNVYMRPGALESHLRQKHADKPLFSREDIRRRIRERRQDEQIRLPAYHHSDEEELVDMELDRDSSSASDTDDSHDGPELVPGLDNWSDHDSDAQSQSSAGDIIPDRERQDEEEQIEIYPDAGKPMGPVPDYENHACLDQPFYPFANARAFSTANEMIQNNWSDKQIDRWFNGGNQPNSADLGFQSAHLLQKHLDGMDGHLPRYTSGKVTIGGRRQKFYVRDPVQCAAYLIKQRCYRKYLSYAPRREYTGGDTREPVYSEMCTGNWWWETQEKLPNGATVLPLICSSDETHLTNFSGDQKAWPLYVTIGNLDSAVRNKPSYLAYIVVALLPVPPKFQGISKTDDNKLRREAQAALLQVVTHLFQPLQRYSETGIQLPCADGFIRDCHPILASYIADHSEQTKNLHAVKQNCCPKCEVAATATGEYIHEPELYAMRRRPARYIAKYRELRAATEKAEIKEIEDWFEARHAHPRRNLFWNLPLVDAYDLHRPDILHNLHLGTIIPFLLPFYLRLDEVNAILRYDQAFHGVDTSIPQIPSKARLV